MVHMTNARRLALLVPGLLAVGCATASSPPEGSSEDALSELAYRYTCTATKSSGLVRGSEISMIAADGHLSFTDGAGAHLGDRDRSYASPWELRLNPRARYVGFSSDGTCTLKAVVDAAAAEGAASAKLRVECADDRDYREDLYTCSAPERVTLDVPPKKGVDLPPSLGAFPRNWTCSAGRGDTRLFHDLSVRVDAGAIVIDSDQATYEGRRDESYARRAGFLGYAGFTYGGDCELRAEMQGSGIEQFSKNAVLDVSCVGEVSTHDEYQCTPVLGPGS